MSSVAIPIMCVECEDTEASKYCESCMKDPYCDLCFQAQHRSGNRKKHQSFPLEGGADSSPQHLSPSEELEEVPVPIASTSLQSASETPLVPGIEDSQVAQETTPTTVVASSTKSVVLDLKHPNLSRAKNVALRLSTEERVYLSLLNAALSVSEYTDNVDVIGSYRSSSSRRILREWNEILGCISGMAVVNHFNRGKKLMLDKSFHDNEVFFKEIFEIGRRYKIMNPEAMRSNYGKMIYMLQDASDQNISRALQVSLSKPIDTVFHFLQSREALAMLCDPLFDTACGTGISSESESTPALKAAALATLGQSYSHEKLSVDDITRCVASFGDNASYIKLNVGPINRMLALLSEFFQDAKPPSGHAANLAISAGRGGARLTHSHGTQMAYVTQTFILWKTITTHMSALWLAAETDLLSETHGYRLRDTGQGLNRLQSAPSTSRLALNLLRNAQQTCGNAWVGSSVIHLGDHNVCNALMFIDKYSQISRILSPIVQTIDGIDRLCADSSDLSTTIDKMYGGPEALKRTILADFFKHGFDGSGAENFFDAGSCIDGRLTSAWNWCSNIEKKSYYRVFLLTGFVGFDGEFH